MDVNPPILIIDPVMLFREGLSRILCEADFEPVWCSDRPPSEPVTSGTGVMSPVVIVGSGLERAARDIAQVKRHHPTALVVLLVGSNAKDDGTSPLECGADTILNRDSSLDTLIGALKLMKDGVCVISSDLMAAILSDRSRSRALPGIRTQESFNTTSMQTELPSQLSNLSAREFSVLYHLLDGLSNKEIARRLNLAEATIKVHVKAILRKAHVHNRTQVVMWASRQGFRAKHQTVDGSVEQPALNSVIRTNGVGPGYHIELAAAADDGAPT